LERLSVHWRFFPLRLGRISKRGKKTKSHGTVVGTRKERKRRRLRCWYPGRTSGVRTPGNQDGTFIVVSKCHAGVKTERIEKKIKRCVGGGKIREQRSSTSDREASFGKT